MGLLVRRVVELKVFELAAKGALEFVERLMSFLEHGCFEFNE